MNTPKLDPVEEKTVQAFDAEAELQFKMDPPGRAGDDLRFAFTLAPTNPLVLDVGCGYGRVVPHLRQIGAFRYVGIDPSIEMLRIGAREHPELDLRPMNLYELPQNFPESRFDIAIAITTLAYVTMTRMGEALTSIRKVLVHGGIGYFTYMNVNETIRLAQNWPVDANYPDPPATLTGWKFERIQHLLKRSGFKPERVYGYGDSPLYSIIVKAI